MAKSDAPERDLSRQIEAAKAIIEGLSVELEDDAELVSDTIEGETYLFEAMDRCIAQDRECDVLLVGLSKVIEQLTARKSAIVARKDRLRSIMTQALSILEQKTMVRPEATITLKATPPKLIVEEEADIPSEFFVTAEPKLDAKALAERLKLGDKIPGAMMSGAGVTIQVKRG